MDKKILACTVNLENYISAEQYKGFDPYDGLMSPIFKLPLLRSSKKIRFISQQLIKKSPLNLRPAIGIKKGYNPVTLGLCIQAYSYILQSYDQFADIQSKDYFKLKIDFLIKELLRLSTKGFDGICWGYDFHWEARHASNPAYSPTVVATGFITNALFEYFKYSNDKDVFSILESSSAFVMNNLNRYAEGGKFCFSYSPSDKQIVYNATMKAARLLSQVYSVNGDKALLDAARNTVGFVIENQRNDGSWGYSKGDNRDWTDNFHTGYILDCLDEYIKNTSDNSYISQLTKGAEFYSNNFFADATNGSREYLIPKYYNDFLYPIDSTAIAQSILTLCRFGFTEKAERVINWTLDNMYDNKGYFFYRKYKHCTNRTSFMRWSNAWMLLALSFYVNKQNKSK
ncbi:MAG: delta-aminolevulinic acid dehydratase [Ignavibacteria bacterium]|nr:delta-aminolevulinic acid dehydratase [Ignavibacteria bacterium]